MTALLLNNTIKYYLLALFVLTLLFHAHAQEQYFYRIKLKSSGVTNNTDSIKIENLTNHKTLMLYGKDVMYLHSNDTGLNLITEKQSDLMIYPNPSDDRFTLDFFAPFPDDVMMEIYDIRGLRIISKKIKLSVGRNFLWVYNLVAGTYVLKIHSARYNITGKLISKNKYNSTDKTDIYSDSELSSGVVKFRNSTYKKEFDEKLDEKYRVNTIYEPGVNESIESLFFTTGDILKITGYSNGNRTIVIDSPTQNEEIILNFKVCTDPNNNNYSIIQIGNQTWMCENLKSSRYRDSVAIDKVSEDLRWKSLSSGAYCNFNNDSIYSNKYGYLYNWYAVTDNRNIAPYGWHIPSKEEFEELLRFLNTKASLVNKTEQKSENNIEQQINIIYKSFFKSYYGGVRDENAFFERTDSMGHWWALSGNKEDTIGLSLHFDSVQELFLLMSSKKKSGQSVRCVLGDFPIVKTTGVDSISSNNAVFRGIISSDGNLPITTQGVCYSITPNPTIANKCCTNIRNGKEDFTCYVEKLNGNTTYYARTFATNSYGTSYGDEICFTTAKNKLKIAGYSDDIVLFKHTDGRIFCTKSGDFSVFDRNGSNKITLYNFSKNGFSGYNIQGAILLPSGTVVVALTKYNQTLTFLRSTNATYSSWEIVNEDWNGSILYRGWAVNPDGTLLAGEYPTSNNISKVRLWKITDDGKRWQVVQTFNGRQGNLISEKTIFHIHTVGWDKYTGHFWIGCGDNGNEPSVWEYDGTKLTLIGEANQNWRTTSFIFTPDYVIYGADGCMPVGGKCNTYVVRINKKTKQLEPVRQVYEYYNGSIFNNEIITDGSNLTYLMCGTPNNIYLSNDANKWYEVLSLKLNPQKLDAYSWFYNFVDNGDGRIYGYITGILREDTDAPFVGTIMLDLK